MQITKQAIVNAPAEEVWRVVAHEFDRIGSWATAVSASHEVTDAVPVAGCAVGGRACHTTTGLFPVVEERIVAYDEAARTLTYEPVRGMPAFMGGAHSTWWVVAVDDRRSRVSFTATVNIRGVAAPIMRLAMRLQIGRAGTAASMTCATTWNTADPRLVSSADSTVTTREWPRLRARASCGRPATVSGRSSATPPPWPRTRRT